MINYNVCRWCKHFKDGCCFNEDAFVIGNDNFDFYKFYEDGTLSETISESFETYHFEKLVAALHETKLSKKKIKEIMQVFETEMADAQLNWTETIDESVSIALNNFDFGYLGGVYIKDPDEFSCKYFW